MNVDTTISVNGNSQYEIYDYPGEYLKKAEGDDLVKLRMEEEEAMHTVLTGTSTCRAFVSGCRFDLEGHSSDAMNATLSAHRGAAHRLRRGWLRYQYRRR